MNANIYPTYRCTLNCPRCAARASAPDTKPTDMTWERFSRFVERLQEQKVRLNRIQFASLEPTLWIYLVDAIELVRRERHASISFLQRRLRIGYVRAARLVDALEERGVVGPAEGGRHSRTILEIEEVS